MVINKRLRVIALILILVVSMFSDFGATANAASIKTYTTMDAIPEDLDIFNTMAKGQVSALQVNGEWYYDFTMSGKDTIRVKVSAFTETSHTNTYLADDNAALTKSINSTSATRNDSRFNYYVSTTKASKSVISNNGVTNVDLYTTARWRSKLSANAATSDKITLTAEITHFITFEFAAQVVVDERDTERPFTDGGKYVTPENAYEYVSALNRYSNLNVTPIVELSITNTGDLGAFLNQYALKGKGSAKKGTNVSDLISVGYSAAKLAVSFVPNFSSLYNLYKLINEVASLGSSSSTYTSATRHLSLKKVFVYKAKFVSPIKLTKCGEDFKGDYLQIDVDFANTKSGYSGRGTAQLKVAFSFSK